jgi:guanyl-specific ribonuclease Sa
MRRARFVVRVVWLLSFVACGTEAGVDLAIDAPAQNALSFEDAAHHCGAYVLNTPIPEGTCTVDNAVVRNFAVTMYTGTVNVTACVARIEVGQKLPYRHDGTVFRNAEQRLPKAPAGHYHEYVDPTPGIDGPGPQRLVWAGQQEWYYTPDHYDTFLAVHCVQ